MNAPMNSDSDLTTEMSAEAAAIEPTSLDGSTPLPESWTMYFHVPVDRKASTDASGNAVWDMASYLPLFTVTTVDEFWAMFHSLKAEFVTSGLYFFMRQGVEPRYEDPANENGGEWKKKVDRLYSYDAFIELCVYAALGSLLEAGGGGATPNTITGVTIRNNPDGVSNIIKVWNGDAKVASATSFNLKMRFFNKEGLLYESFADKRKKELAYSNKGSGRAR